MSQYSFLTTLLLTACLFYLSPQRLFAQEIPAAPATLQVDAAGFPELDAEWQAALAAVVAAEGGQLPGPAPYTLTAFDTSTDASGEWALAVIVPSAVVAGGWEDLDLDQLVDVLLHRTADGRSEGHVRTHEAFFPLAQAAPRQLVDYSPLFAARPAAAQETQNYLLPWTAGQTWWLGGGWHSGYGSDALDFGPLTADDPATNSAVLAAAGGTLRMACTNDDQQRLLWIEQPDGTRTGYLHLDRASVAAAVEATGLVGQQVAQGTLLGTLYRGEAKIDGACPASFPGCTFNTLCGYGNAPHVHFVLPSRDVTIEGIAAETLASGAAGSRFTSSNRRQDTEPTPAPSPTPSPVPSPTPVPDTEPPTAQLVPPLGNSRVISPAQDGTLAITVVATDTGGAGVAGSGVAGVQVQLAWQEDGGAWQPAAPVTATSGAGGVFTATVSACTPGWRVPHNRPLRVSLDVADNAGNHARSDAAGVFRYSFPDLNHDCIVEIKDVFDLLPALRDGANERPEHDVDGSGSFDAADAAALLGAVYGGAPGAGRVGAPAAAHVGVRTGQDWQADAGQGVATPAAWVTRVRFTAWPPPAGFASARDVAIAGSTVLAADWRAGGMTVVDLSSILSPTLHGVLPLGDRTYGVTIAGSLTFAGDTPDDGPARLSLISLRGLVQSPALTMTGTPTLTPTLPLTQALIATATLPGELMEATVLGDRIYQAAGYAGLHVIDVSTREAPMLLGTLDTPGIAADVSATVDAAGATDGARDGATVYVADGASGLRIYRIETITPSIPVTPSAAITPGLPITPTEPLSVTLLATWDTPGEAIGVTAALSTVYVADGLGGVQVIDAADPARPRLLSTYATASAANSVLASGPLLYVAAGWKGVLALDVSDPTAPRLAGSFDTPGYAHDLALTNDLLLVADGPAGVQLLQVALEYGPAHVLLIPFAAKE